MVGIRSGPFLFRILGVFFFGLLRIKAGVEASDGGQDMRLIEVVSLGTGR